MGYGLKIYILVLSREYLLLTPFVPTELQGFEATPRNALICLGEGDST